MKLKMLAVLTLVVFGCAFASAQAGTLGYGTAAATTSIATTSSSATIRAMFGRALTTSALAVTPTMPPPSASPANCQTDQPVCGRHDQRRDQWLTTSTMPILMV